MMDSTSTSSRKLLAFINGDAVACYGDADTAKKVKPKLLWCMKDAVQDMYDKRRNRYPPFDDTKDYEDPGVFVLSAFGSFYGTAGIGLRRISATFQSAWVTRRTQLEKNLRESGLSANIKLPSREDDDEVVQAVLNRISDTLFNWYLESLRLLASKERAACQPEFPPSFQGHIQPHENMSAIPLGEWDAAWDTEFRGDVLKRLELKLHLNVEAVTNDNNKRDMSRIIPVVQSSGTGKSRLAQE